MPKDVVAKGDPSGGPLCIWSESAIPIWIQSAVRQSRRVVMCVGSPSRDVRTTFGADAHELLDFRSFSACAHGTPLLFVGFGSSASRALIARNHPVVFTTEPWFGHHSPSGSGAYEILLPGSPVDGRLAHASEIFSQAGAPSISQITSLGSLEHGSILARIHDAASFLLRWMGTPERVSAAVGGDRRHRTRDDQPDAASRSFRRWVGSFAITCQYADGRAGLIMASNQHPTWSRSALACGDFGAVRVDDATLEWRDAHNAIVDRGAQTPGEWEGACHTSVTAASLRTGSALGRTLAPDQGAHCRAFVEAACLSAYTLEAESPFKLAEILAAN